jgi:hypothetical protein
MFDRLRRPKKAGIERGRALELLHDFLPLLDNSHNGVVGLAAGRFVEFLKHLFKPGDVLFGLDLMLVEGRP